MAFLLPKGNYALSTLAVREPERVCILFNRYFSQGHGEAPASLRTIGKNWLAEKKKMPWWIPELLRLQHTESVERSRQMRMTPIIQRYNLQTAKFYNFRLRDKTEIKQQTPKLAQVIKLHA